ncbi:hypothetical protein SLEP1_g2346 [Rubroshorea leprosula]|uniref:Uncharacterized protein n=1 Tax=Rubroshorea leprosula TaxID=152421 RepID=A0AAV5HQZ8_9ROSI|nr:hypothetical protein SLEP1_g2346 [Rubroshorea leprosula]
MLAQLQRYRRRNLPLFINFILTSAKEGWLVEEVDKEECVSLFIPSKIVPAIPYPEPSYAYQVSLRTKLVGQVLEIIASRIDDRRRMIVLRVPGQDQREIRGALQFTGFAPGEHESKATDGGWNYKYWPTDIVLVGPVKEPEKKEEPKKEEAKKEEGKKEEPKKEEEAKKEEPKKEEAKKEEPKKEDGK